MPDSSKNYKLLHEHNGKIQELDVFNDGNKGIVFTDQFSSFMLVEYDSNETTNNNDTVMNSNTWDDGGPFTTDACDSVYDRWGNKLYDAGACDIDSNNGYKLVNTSDK